MKLIGVLPAVGILVAMLAAAGCAGTPSKPRSAAAERTPSWMKHHVVGSRIPRRVDAKNDADTFSRYTDRLQDWHHQW
jgi:hypothetical protein